MASKYDEHKNHIINTMKLNIVLQLGAVLMVAVAVVACCNKSTKSAAEEGFPVPEKPIEEMCYTPSKTTFEVWGPTAESAVVRLYDGDERVEEIAMERAESGLWRATAEGDRKGLYYAFQLTVDG